MSLDKCQIILSDKLPAVLRKDGVNLLFTVSVEAIIKW